MFMFVVSVFMIMMVTFVIVRMGVGMFGPVSVSVFMSVLVFVMMFMVMLMRQMNVELHSFDLRFLFSRRVQVVAIKTQLFQFVFELVKFNAEIEHCADEHVATDAAKNIEIKCFHLL